MKKCFDKYIEKGKENNEASNNYLMRWRNVIDDQTKPRILGICEGELCLSFSRGASLFTDYLKFKELAKDANALECRFPVHLIFFCGLT
ncbi:hypothetical protein NC651_037793 [Populus alba x Populus x berolinensis]|nr:hypothetical protein NC651_037793 [Populus alba x Populus x berolinensis]